MGLGYGTRERARAEIALELEPAVRAAGRAASLNDEGSALDAITAVIDKLDAFDAEAEAEDLRRDEWERLRSVLRGRLGDLVLVPAAERERYCRFDFGSCRRGGRWTWSGDPEHRKGCKQHAYDRPKRFAHYALVGALQAVDPQAPYRNSSAPDTFEIIEAVREYLGIEARA